MNKYKIYGIGNSLLDYEYKVKTWYYGTEKAVADNVTIGYSVGWEYLFNY